MADQPKRKPLNQKNANDERRNKKAFKKKGASRNRKTRLTEVQKVLMGGGSYRNIAKPKRKQDAA